MGFCVPVRTLGLSNRDRGVEQQCKDNHSPEWFILEESTIDDPLICISYFRINQRRRYEQGFPINQNLVSYPSHLDVGRRHLGSAVFYLSRLHIVGESLERRMGNHKISRIDRSERPGSLASGRGRVFQRAKIPRTGRSKEMRIRRHVLQRSI